MNVFFLSLSLLLSTLSVFAEETWSAIGPKGFAAEAKLLESKLTLPNPVKIELILSFPSSYHVDERGLIGNLLRAPLPGAAPFALISIDHEQLMSDIQDVSKGKWSFILEPQLTGKQALTFLNISFIPHSKNEKIVELISGIFWVQISLPKQEEIFLPSSALPLNLSGNYPIELDPTLRAEVEQKDLNQNPQYNLKVWNAKKFPWEAAFILTLLLLFALYLMLRPRKKILPAKPFQSQLFYNQAVEKLQSLQQQTVINPTIATAFIVDLSNAVRSHLEETHGLNLQYMTTEEFFTQFDASDILDAQRLERLKKFTQKVDQVKFASHAPTLEECLSALQAAQQI